MKKERNLITVDLTNCKNWNECQKVMNLITNSSVKIMAQPLKNLKQIK